jgi:hypothetical protein
MQIENSTPDNHHSRVLPVLLAGLAGGLTEIVWITLYSSLSSTSATTVADQIATTVLHVSAGVSFTPALGVGIHMLLSIVLATAFVLALYGPIARRYGATGIFISGLATLAAVWAVNFFILLPILNPRFPLLMPYAVTFTSKLLFGAAMSWVLIKSEGRKSQRRLSVPPM